MEYMFRIIVKTLLNNWLSASCNKLLMAVKLLSQYSAVACIFAGTYPVFHDRLLSGTRPKLVHSTVVHSSCTPSRRTSLRSSSNNNTLSSYRSSPAGHLDGTVRIICGRVYATIRCPSVRLFVRLDPILRSSRGARWVCCCMPGGLDR